MKKTTLRSYAKLIARKGCNVQKGQDVFLTASIEQPEFTTMVVDELYKAGARKVFVDLSYQPMEKYHVRHRSVVRRAYSVSTRALSAPRIEGPRAAVYESGVCPAC